MWSPILLQLGMPHQTFCFSEARTQEVRDHIPLTLFMRPPILYFYKSAGYGGFLCNGYEKKIRVNEFITTEVPNSVSSIQIIVWAKFTFLDNDRPTVSLKSNLDLQGQHQPHCFSNLSDYPIPYLHAFSILIKFVTIRWEGMLEQLTGVKYSINH